MFSRLSQTGLILAILAGTLPLSNQAAEGQTFRQQGRMRARANRQLGRAEAQTYGNAGTGYYAPGGYYGGYAPAYGGYYGGPGYFGPSYYGGPAYYGGSRYYSGYASAPVYGGGAYPPTEGSARPPFARQRSYLGITMSETPDGVVRISGVRTNSPAAEAGLRVGDVLLALNGREIYSAQDVSRMVARHVPGDAVALDIDRNGRNDRVEALLTGQTGQFVAGAPAGGGFVPDYVEPTFNQPEVIAPMEARRAPNQALDPNLYPAY